MLINTNSALLIFNFNQKRKALFELDLGTVGDKWRLGETGKLPEGSYQ